VPTVRQKLHLSSCADFRNRLYIAQNAKPPFEQIELSIVSAAETAPSFRAYRGRIRYDEAPAKKRISEHKAITKERCAELERICALRVNEQPALKSIVDKYAIALKKLRKDRGAYRLFILGLDIETYIKIKNSVPPDPDRNPPLDADILFAVQSLMIAHAGLVALFPDVERSARELDQYRELSLPIDSLRNRVLEPVLHQLAESKDIFDADTLQITREIEELQEIHQTGDMAPTRGVFSTMHAWLRGALSSMGQFILRQVREITKATRDALVKEVVAAIVKDPDRLTAAIMSFLGHAKPMLLALANTFDTAFGWIRALLSLLGLGG
jgi:hypothetical protein